MTPDPASGGPPLARLFAIAYRLLIDGLHDRLQAQGWTDVRPAYGFVLLAARDHRGQRGWYASSRVRDGHDRMS